MATTVSACIARTQLGALLKEAAQHRARFVITKSGKPTAVLLSISDFDDMLEEVDPEFRKSLTAAAREHHSGRAATLRELLSVSASLPAPQQPSAGVVVWRCHL
jgi:prevent-host-death family protein